MSLLLYGSCLVSFAMLSTLSFSAMPEWDLILIQFMGAFLLSTSEYSSDEVPVAEGPGVQAMGLFPD